VFDYGCGRGGDLRRLRARGFPCEGWDPAFRPRVPPAEADVVNLGYVVNVIEHPRERSEALKHAWSLTRELLIVSAQLEYDMKGERLVPFSDGFLTRSNTFQKYYSQAELQTWLETTLSTPAVAAAPGIFYVFRDRTRAEDFAAERYRRARHTSSLSRARELAQEHAHLVQPALDFYEERGRFPAEEELPDLDEINAAFGSSRRFYSSIRRVFESEAFDRAALERREDLLIYVAMSRFSRRPRFSDLSRPIQLDIKAHFQSYRSACNRADLELIALGDMEHIRTACSSRTAGKLMPTALYLHRSALQDQPLALRLYEACASNYLGDVSDANIIKLSVVEPKISYLTYADFEKDPHPRLSNSLSVSLQTFRVRERDYSDSANPPILHRKETFVCSTHPLFERFQRLTAQEERFGLYAEPSSIGTLVGWKETLERIGVELRGHRVVRRRIDAGEVD